MRRMSCVLSALVVVNYFAVPAGYPGSAWAEVSEKDCAGAIQDAVPPDAKVTVATTEGETLEGTLNGIDSRRAMLSLRTYDSSASRFLDREVELQRVRTVHYREVKKNMAIPVFFAVAFAAVGMGAGYAIKNDPDWGGVDSDKSGVPVGLALVGATVGFVPAFVLTPSHKTDRVITCGVPAGD